MGEQPFDDEACDPGPPPVGLVDEAMAAVYDAVRQAEERVALTRRPDIAPEALSLLAGDPCGHVRMAVAAHERTPEDILSDMLYDSDFDVLVGLASNTAVSEDILLSLAQGDNVRSYLVLVALAKNPASSAGVLVLVTGHGYVDEYVLDALLDRPDVDEWTLNLIADMGSLFPDQASSARVRVDSAARRGGLAP